MTRNRCAAVALLLAAGVVPGRVAAEEAAAPENHGYFGAGLMLSTNNSQTPIGDFSSAGGGILLNGAGVIGTGGGLGLGLTGALGFGSRTDSDTDETIAEGLFGFDAGMIIADLLYLSVGLQLLGQTPDSSDVTATYTVVPVGIGMLSASDTGYLLAQLRFGGGELSNDANNATEDVGYFGLRLAGQTGTADGLQFMGGLEFELYDFADIDVTDNFFRLYFGIGFGG